MIHAEDILSTAIARAGGVMALARVIGAKQSTVSMWKARGSLPPGWRAYLLEKLADPQWPRERDSEGRAPVIEEDV